MKKKTRNSMSRLALTTLLIGTSLMSYADSESTLTGTVKDEKGEPLIGVTIMDKTSKQGVTTDADGNFTLKVKKEKDYTSLTWDIRNRIFISTENLSTLSCSRMSSLSMNW